MGKLIDRTGEISYTFFGEKMTIIKYNNSKDIIVKFEDTGYELNTRMSQFLTGDVRDPLYPSVYGHGYIGVGEYKVSIKQKHTPAYNAWYDMLKRCYCKEYSKKHNTYEEAEVCEEWLNFQNFAKWFYDNYYEIDNVNQRMELDKDILIKGNKIYSPKTCVFIPKRINTLFVKCNKVRGDLPIGVDDKRNKNGGYTARCCCGSGINDTGIKRVWLGTFKTPEEAFYAYKEVKEKYIKQIADEYKPYIPQKLYDAMYRYEVDITD